MKIPRYTLFVLQEDEASQPKRQKLQFTLNRLVQDQRKKLVIINALNFLQYRNCIENMIHSTEKIPLNICIII